MTSSYLVTRNPFPFLRPIYYYWKFYVFVALAFSLIRPSPGIAASLDCQLYYPDAQGNNRPTYAIIRCPYAGQTSDTILVYDQDGDMQAASDWQTSTDFDSDLWIFDPGGDGTASLIINFKTTPAGLTADLYDDQDRDGRVAFEIQDGQPAILEGKHPTLIVTAPDGWWLQDGKINYNLKIQVDGPARATFFSYASRFPDLSVDGKTDYTVEIQDTNRDGRPDIELRQVLLPAPQGEGVHTELIVNTNHREVPPAQDYLFWPYLGQPPDYIKPYQAGYPPVFINWKNSQIIALTEFVASRGQEANWFIYSSFNFGQPDQPDANFENPFAFYDLANDQDGQPELIIRNEYSWPHDASFLRGFYSQPIEAIRYSWDQYRDSGLDFKLDLIGRHPITDTIQLPGIEVHSINYEEYPHWVTNKTWDAAHFVAVEYPGYRSTEGIYEGFSRDWRDYYVTGLTDNQFLDRLRNTNLGIRHEYTPDLLRQPWLYFSPLDHKLHLQGAIGGYWNIDPQRSLHYADLDKDGYLDQWLLTQTTRTEDSVTGAVTLSETPHALLQVYAGKVFSASAGQVRIVESHVDPSSFRTLPPTNHAEWLALGDKLASHASPIASDDLAAIAAQYSGPLTEIHGAQLEGFHTTDQGYAFTIKLSPGYQVLTDELGLLDSNLPAGNYRVEYNGSYQFTPLAHEQPTLSASPLSVSPESPQQPGWATLQVTLENTGAGALENLPIQVYANQPGLEKPLLLTTPRLDLPAGETTTLSLPWWPLQSGTWEIWLEIEPDLLRERNIQVDPLPRRQVEVQPAAAMSMFQPLSASAGGRLTGPVIGLLLSASLAAFAIVALILSKLSKAP